MFFQVQGKDPSVEFTQDIVEESEDERCFDDMMGGADSVPPIELPPCDVARLEEISELVSSCLPSPMRREKLAVALESEGCVDGFVFILLAHSVIQLTVVRAIMTLSLYYEGIV